ncbi:cytochrome P450 3A29-like isoform X2 [Saccostrea cucullata]|uniref:cytochrome P450 3A29-like isoform X2 n=1 Tax=Saccostrea cuccullata TaxID=36930 RepID=UPI002ED04B5A
MDLHLCCLLDSWALSLAGIVVVVFLLLWLRRREAEDYQRRTGIPAPEGILPLIGHLYQVIKMGVDDYERKWFNEKKTKIIVSWYGKTPLITVADPEIAKHVLVKDFPYFQDRPRRIYTMTQTPVNKGVFFHYGSHWKRIRSILTPTFSTGKLKMTTHDINRCSANLADKMENMAKAKENVEVKQLYGGFTLDAIAATAFGLDVDSINNPDSSFIKNIKEIFQRGMKPWRRICITLASVFPSLYPVLRIFNLTFFNKENVGFFVRQCQAMIEDRKTESSERHVDFLQLMVNAELDDQSLQDQHINSGQKKLTNDEIIGQAFLFFVAGYETTANTMNFVSYELAVNQEVQDRVVQEIKDQIGKDEPNYENVNKLQYMEQVILETLRMYPPLPRLTREIGETVVIKDYTFLKGGTVVIPVYGLHHNPDYWPDPEKFDPDRFENSKNVQNKFYYMPFGLGPRMCLGMRLAMLELKIALVHVLRRVRFVPCQETQIPLKVITNKGLITVEKPIKLAFELRD